jgi:hypothetical protein
LIARRGEEMKTSALLIANVVQCTQSQCLFPTRYCHALMIPQKSTLPHHVFENDGATFLIFANYRPWENDLETASTNFNE